MNKLGLRCALRTRTVFESLNTVGKISCRHHRHWPRVLSNWDEIQFARNRENKLFRRAECHLQEVVSQESNTLSSLTNFFQYTGLDRNSYQSLHVLSRLYLGMKAEVDAKPNLYWKQESYLRLINDLYFELWKSHGFQLPSSFSELCSLVDTGYNLRIISRPYYRSLAFRWMRDVLTGVIYPKVRRGELDAEHAFLALKILIALPQFRELSRVEHQFSEENAMDRSDLLQSLVDWHKNNVDLFKTDRMWMIMFFHMLYRQHFRPRSSSQLQFLQFIAEYAPKEHGELLLALFKADRMYHFLSKESVMCMLDWVMKEMASIPFQDRDYIMLITMRLCYLLAEKPYVREFTAFFDLIAEDYLRNSTAQCKSKNVSMLLKACMIANHRLADVVVKKLCTLFVMSCSKAFLEQTINICKALVGMDMVHLGEDIIASLLLQLDNESFSSKSALNALAVDLYLWKTLEIEHGHLLDKYNCRKALDNYIRKNYSLKATTLHFTIGFGSFYDSFLTETIGSDVLLTTQLLPFFTDIDHVFMVDEDGNMLPSSDIQVTEEMLPQEFLRNGRLEQCHSVPDESPVTGVLTDGPVLSKSDVLFSFPNNKNSLLKTWSRKKGHLIHLVLTSRDESGHLFGVCAWQRRLVNRIRPKVNCFEVDHDYMCQVAEILASDDESREKKDRVKNDCVEYIRKLVKYAIETTLKEAETNKSIRQKTENRTSDYILTFGNEVSNSQLVANN